VVAHDRRDVGNAGKDGLVAAGEARHEVRLDEAQHDAPVGLNVLAVQPDFVPVFSDAGQRKGGRVMRVVIDDPAPREDVCAEHRLQFVGCVRAVGARSHASPESHW
jgi:hypothetical protein